MNSRLLPLFISYRSSGEKLIRYQGNSSCVIMSVILITTLFYKALISQGEIWCWSLSGLKGLSPNIHMKILLQIHLHVFPLRISWENFIKYQSISTLMINFFILLTFSLDDGRKLMLVDTGRLRPEVQPLIPYLRFLTRKVPTLYFTPFTYLQ